MGLSYDAVVSILDSIGVPIAKGTACGYVLRAGAEARRLRARAERRRMRFAGMDTTVFKVKGRTVIAAFVTDALRGDSVAIEFLDRDDAESLARVLRKAVGDGLEVLVTDDAGPYGTVAESMGCAHNLCNAHFKKAFARRVKSIITDLAASPNARRIKRDLNELRRYARRGRRLSVRLLTAATRMLPDYLAAPPPECGARASPEYRVRLLLTDLVERGDRLFTHNGCRADGGRYRLDGTNNVTERAIGLDGKWRYRSMRGAKSKKALRNVLNLHAYIRQQRLAGDKPLELTSLLVA
jgi:transposase-like protein